MSKHNKQCILLNNLGSKHSALTKFGQFMSYYKRKDFIKKFYKNCDLKTSPRPICVCKDLSTTSIGICPNQHTDLLIFLFTGGSLKIKRGLELVSRPHFFHFYDKKFSFVILHKLENFCYQTMFTSKFFGKMCSVFPAQAFDEVMIFEYLKI